VSSVVVSRLRAEGCKNGARATLRISHEGIYPVSYVGDSRGVRWKLSREVPLRCFWGRVAAAATTAIWRASVEAIAYSRYQLVIGRLSRDE